jgi:hypothetical protein
MLHPRNEKYLSYIDFKNLNKQQDEILNIFQEENSIEPEDLEYIQEVLGKF